MSKACTKCHVVKSLDAYEPFGNHRRRAICYDCRHPDIARIQNNIITTSENSQQVLQAVKKQEGTLDDLIQSWKRTNELLVAHVNAYHDLSADFSAMKNDFDNIKNDIDNIKNEVDTILSHVSDPTIKNKLSSVYEKLIIMSHLSTSPRTSINTSPRASVNL